MLGRKAASVSGSQLTHYFADKGTLIREVVRRQIAGVLDFHRQSSRDLDSFTDFERWIDLNMRYLRRIGTSGGTPTDHALVAQLAKSDDTTRATLATGYWQWVALLESAIQRMKGNGVLIPGADPRRLALAIITAHQAAAPAGGGHRRRRLRAVPHRRGKQTSAVDRRTAATTQILSHPRQHWTYLGLPAQ
ncbi:TetR/AcrR family transcriptional regulator [Mycobacterium tilburgii]|uniref:TetR/AcrR family transcriptional regulator n=1 Tax=Mycobacterium tilburgii TaxID=44467 RepID=UPI0016426F30|nr:hypothetical protein [Mycobacterium tilburgii]